MSFFSRLFGKKKKIERSGKLRLYSMRKVGDRTIFKIEKRQSFYDEFRHILVDLGFKDVDTWHYDPVLNREFPIRKLNNFVDTFKGKGCEVDVIFTQDRVLVILKSSDVVRRKVVEKLMNFCEWVE